MSVLSNIINVYIAPAKIFEKVKDFNFKQALPPLLILMVVGVLSYWAVQDLAMEVGYNTAVEGIENSSHISDEQKEERIAKVEDRMAGPQFIAWIASAFGGPITALFMALVALLVGNSIMGGSAKYGQLLNITAWAYMINILESIIKIPLMLKKWSFEVYTGLGVLGIGEKGSFLHSFLAGFDVFSLWRIVLIAIGMGLIYNKKTKPYLVALLVVWLIFRIIGAGFTSIFGGLVG